MEESWQHENASGRERREVDFLPFFWDFFSLGLIFLLVCCVSESVLKSVVSTNAAPVITHCQINRHFFAVGKGVLLECFLFLHNSSNADARERHTKGVEQPPNLTLGC